MKVIGYGDKLAVEAGECIEFKVSCTEKEYLAELVQPSHSESLRRVLEASITGRYPGRCQEFPRGSYVSIDCIVPRLAELRIEFWLYSTMPGGNMRELVVWEDGHGVYLNEQGLIELRCGGDILCSGKPLLRAEWYRVTAEVVGGMGSIRLVPRKWAEGTTTMAPMREAPGEARLRIGKGFDGKLDSVRIDGVAAWDFSIGIQTTIVRDVSGHALHGQIVNMPMRGVTGWNWSGEVQDYKHAPHQYGAMHFHSDDLEDAGWLTDFVFQVPEDLESGLYAVKLSAGGEEDHIPFFVRPKAERRKAKVAFLAPTFSYLAYSCETSGTKTSAAIPDEERARMNAALSKEDIYAADHKLLSLYDHHEDGTGNCFVSRLRPIPNMRPYYISLPIWGPHQLGADLHIIDWLRASGMEFEVLTDEDLHHEGLAAISSYNVVLSGTHPEYWSGPMLDSVERFLEKGGRFMYLGGNGMYWVTDTHQERPHVVEVRRTQAGTRAWQSAPGENYQQTTGEPGGLWRYRGRSPHVAFGIGMAAHGYDFALPYQRCAASFDEKYAWIFEGVGADEPIGDFGATMGGAAGFEIDSFDREQGSPEDTVLLATCCAGFSDSYQGVVENVMMEDSLSGGTVNKRVRADMTYLAYPNGGAVFSTGSVCWGTSLMHNDCLNNVSRITENVLRRFAM